MTDLSEKIYQLLAGGHSLVLATVVDHSGSTPRGAGAKMIVRKDGVIHGTIGGGGVEAEVIRCAADLFRTGGSVIRRFNFSSTDAAGSMGMICGGEMDVLLERLDPADAENLEIFGELSSRLRSGKQSLLVRLISADSSPPEASPSRFLVTDAAAAPEILSPESAEPESTGPESTGIDAKALENLMTTAFSRRRPATHTSGKFLVIADPFISSDCVYLFGAGHVSQKLAALLVMVDFRTVVIDDRSDFANRTRFPAIDDIVVPETFAAAFSGLSIKPRDAVVILTRGHAHDQTVLEQALETDAGYIGMIGSRKKRDSIYANLEKKGVSREALQRVHCPIGMDIGARTPEEIAVCIAAQLIAYRAGRT